MNKDTNINTKYHIFVFTIYIVRLLMWLPVTFLVKFLIRMDVEGRDNLKDIPNGRVIFAGNHYSEVDPQAFQYALRFPSKFLPIYFVSLPKDYYTFKEYGLRSFFYGGIFFRLMGAYPVYKGLKDFDKAFYYHKRILDKNLSILIFPEGRRRRGKEPKAKPGVVYLAKKTDALVVPVKFEGVDNLTTSKILLRKSRVKITFGKPIHSGTFVGKNKDLTLDEMKYWSGEIMKIVDSL